MRPELRNKLANLILMFVLLISFHFSLLAPPKIARGWRSIILMSDRRMLLFLIRPRGRWNSQVGPADPGSSATKERAGFLRSIDCIIRAGRSPCAVGESHVGQRRYWPGNQGQRLIIYWVVREPLFRLRFIHNKEVVRHFRNWDIYHEYPQIASQIRHVFLVDYVY